MKATAPVLPDAVVRSWQAALGTSAGGIVIEANTLRAIQRDAAYLWYWRGRLGGLLRQRVDLLERTDPNADRSEL